MPRHDGPFYDRRALPTAFPLIEITLPPHVRAELEDRCVAFGDKLSDIITDEMTLAVDAQAGAVSDAEIAAYFADLADLATTPWPAPDKEPAPTPAPGQPTGAPGQSLGGRS